MVEVTGKVPDGLGDRSATNEDDGRIREAAGRRYGFDGDGRASG